MEECMSVYAGKKVNCENERMKDIIQYREKERERN